MLLFPMFAAVIAAVLPAQFEVSRPGSHLLAVTGKAGLFGFAGHEHAIIAPQWTARLEFDPQNPSLSSAVITIPVAALVIDSPEARQLAGLGSGPSPEDVKKIQARILGPEVLDAARYPTITLKIVSAQPAGADRLLVTGDLALRGRSRRLAVPVRYQRENSGAYVFDGDLKIRQTDFGIRPESGGAGTVKVKDEMQIRFRISAVPAS